MCPRRPFARIGCRILPEIRRTSESGPVGTAPTSHRRGHSVLSCLRFAGARWCSASLCQIPYGGRLDRFSSPNAQWFAPLNNHVFRTPGSHAQGRNVEVTKMLRERSRCALPTYRNGYIGRFLCCIAHENPQANYDVARR